MSEGNWVDGTMRGLEPRNRKQVKPAVAEDVERYLQNGGYVQQLPPAKMRLNKTYRPAAVGDTAVQSHE
jgi:hypothetical protein